MALEISLAQFNKIASGKYTESVKNRLTYSPNTLEAATKLVETFVWHCDTEHSEYYTSEADNARVALAQLTAALRAVGDNSYQIDIGV